MGEIVKHKKDEIYVNEQHIVIIPKKLPISKKNRDLYLANKNYPKICMIEDKNISVKALHITINKTIMDKGVNITTEEINYLLQTVTNDIMVNFSHFTLQEINLACYYGVRGELGEYFGINPTTFYKWFKNFKYDLLPQANKAINKYLPKPKERVINQRNMDLSTAKTILDVYFKLVTTGEYNFYDYGSVGYNFLDRIGLINFSKDEKLEFMKLSRIAFRKNTLEKNRKLSLLKKDIQKINTTRVFKELEEQSNPTIEHQIKIGAKRLAIRKYLYNLAEEEIDLKVKLKLKLSKIQYKDEK